MVEIGQKCFISEKVGIFRGKVVVFRQSGCVQAKVVIFG